MAKKPDTPKPPLPPLPPMPAGGRPPRNPVPIIVNPHIGPR